jgi:hypothetical protein
MPYIRQVHVEYPGTSNEHISQVRHSQTTVGALTASTREQIVAELDRGRSYRSHNDRTGDEARVEARRSSGGTR